jgi:flavin reductase (DIM6/NTAB) family NADH-FMN oxidoreductase RutF
MPVVVLAVEHGGRRSCSSVTAMYAALVPATLVISLARHSSTTGLVLDAGVFSASALHDGQASVAVSAGGRTQADDKFADLGIAAAEPDEQFGQPSVAGAPVAWCCRVTDQVIVGDHVVVFGEIVAVRGAEAVTPLLRHDRRYAGLGEDTDVQDAGGYPL